jgi:small subunit ribosomal protein S16
MAVRIRLSRIGRKNKAFFRVGAYDARTPRNGKCIEQLGWYDPHQVDDAKKIQVDAERVKYWISVGACATPTTYHLLKKIGIAAHKKS